MADPKQPSLEEAPANQAADSGNPVKEIRGFLKAVSRHAAALKELASIEAREAGQFAARKVALGILSAVAGLFFYALLMAGLTGWLAALLTWPWWGCALLLAAVHLVALFVLLLLLSRKPGQTLFAETKAQLQRDRQCLSQAKPDANKL